MTTPTNVSTKRTKWTKLILVFALTTSFLSSLSYGQETKTSLFDLPATKLQATPGQFVLCPSRQFFDEAVKKGVEKTTFIYYAATLIESDDQVSKVRNLAGTEFSLPNQLIVPIPMGQTAEVGDVVLTWWQSGSGMQRAIVVGGTPAEPVVRYLDIAFNNPSGAGQKEDTLRRDSFCLLTEAWQIGTTVAVSEGRQIRHGQLVAVSDSKVLVREFAGKLKLYDRSKANPIPIVPDLQAGDAAKAAIYGSFKPVTVKRIDHTIGRVFVNFQLGRTEQEKVLSFGDIISDE